MPRILIADRDEPISTLLKTAVCRAVDCEVTTTSDPTSTAEALRSQVFDLVLLDIGMYSDGLETLRHVRGPNERCEVIALTTGAIAAPLLKTLADADVFAVVTKPFDVRQLAGLVAESLRADRSDTANRPLVFRNAGTEPTHD